MVLKKSETPKTPPKSTKGPVRLSVGDKEKRQITENHRKSSVTVSGRRSSSKSSVTVSGRRSSSKSRDGIKKNSHQESEQYDKERLASLPNRLEPEQSKEKAKVVKKFLEQKYKVEFPKGTGSLDVSEDLSRPLTEKEVLARNGLDMDMSQEEQMRLLKIYDKLEDGIQQAEEFFRSIGIEWSSEHQMFKVKPKKFMPAMTMIAFGPGYDDVIVCKDDEETGEVQACVLSKENKDCPKEVTSVNLSVYKDGFQAEDDEFNAYTSDSIRDFFLNNIGSYIIMKPNESTTQTVLIRIVDERERSFDEVQKERVEETSKPASRHKKMAKDLKAKAKKSGNTEAQAIIAEADDEKEKRPKYYTQSNSKTTETLEIFERHKIIKRLEDMPMEDGGMGPSSWYWRNQRMPLSSDYVVPPNITTSSFDTDERVEPNPEIAGQVKIKTPSTSQPIHFNTMQPQNIVDKNQEEKGTSVTESFLNGVNRVNKRARTSVTPDHTLPFNHQGCVYNQISNAVQEQPLHQPSEIKKINIYHGPVTVINLGETSEDSVRVSSREGAKLKVSLRRQRHVTEDTNSLCNAEWKNLKDEETEVMDWEEATYNVRKGKNTTIGPEEESRFGNVRNYPNMFETEYDRAYNRTASKWSEFFSEAANRKSSADPDVKMDLTDDKFQHISLLGKQPTTDQDRTSRKSGPGKKISVLLDLGNHSAKRDSIEGIELNKKTSDTQITVFLRDHNNGNKYLVNIYPEEQLKRIWSILKMNEIDIKNVTPELVLGNSELQGIMKGIDGGSRPTKGHQTNYPKELKNNEGKDVNPLPSITSSGAKGTDVQSVAIGISGSQENDNLTKESERSYQSNSIDEKSPSIQSDTS